MIVQLTEQEWVIFLQAAGLAPYNQIAPLMQKITQQLAQQQLLAQQQAAQPRAVAEEQGDANGRLVQ
jgi:hypothetical protein